MTEEEEAAISCCTSAISPLDGNHLRSLTRTEMHLLYLMQSLQRPDRKCYYETSYSRLFQGETFQLELNLFHLL